MADIAPTVEDAPTVEAAPDLCLPIALIDSIVILHLVFARNPLSHLTTSPPNSVPTKPPLNMMMKMTMMLNQFPVHTTLGWVVPSFCVN